MTGLTCRLSMLTMIFLSFALLISAFMVSPGLFTIDEAIYYAGAEALRSHHTFVVDNGFSELHSTYLKRPFLIEGPNGLVPQYPIGSALFGALLLPVFDVRGLVIMNVLAAIGTLFATRALAKQLFNNDTIAVVAVFLLFASTFWLEYAFGIWPHSVSVFCVTLALTLALQAFSAAAHSHASAFACGVIVGCGLLFRTDTILVLPAIGVTALLFAAKPWHALAWGSLGLMPLLAVSAWANLEKFGTLNPLSYGLNRGGGVDLSTHIVPIIGLALLLPLLFTARRIRWSPSLKRSLTAILCLTGLLLLLIPAGRDLAFRYGQGFWALMIDATSIKDPRSGVEAGPGGTLFFWGYVKKALGQSMPWIGVTLLLVTARWEPRHRQATIFVLVLVAIWTLPFFLLEWHGGMGSNMRYFLPIIPALCVLCAKLLIDLTRSVKNAPRTITAGYVVGYLLILISTSVHPAGTAGTQQHISTFVLGATSLLALLAGREGVLQNISRQLLLTSLGCGIIIATFCMASDLGMAQARRAFFEEKRWAMTALPEKILFVGSPELFPYLSKPKQLFALPDLTSNHDIPLINAALKAGYRVFLPAFAVDADHRAQFGNAIVNTKFHYPGGALVEIRPVLSQKD